PAGWERSSLAGPEPSGDSRLLLAAGGLRAARPTAAPLPTKGADCRCSSLSRQPVSLREIPSAAGIQPVIAGQISWCRAVCTRPVRFRWVCPCELRAMGELLRWLQDVRDS